MNRRRVLLATATALLLEDEDEPAKKKRKIWARNFYFRGASNPYFHTLMADLTN